MKFAKFTNEEESRFNIIRKRVNIGDNIQSLAVDILYSKLGIPKSDVIKVGYFSTEKILTPCYLIVQGHFSRQFNMQFIYNHNIKPLFLGFALMDSKLLKEEISYFKNYEPILCRDEFTKYVLNKYGIEAYVCGCLSLIIDKPDNVKKNKNREYYFVDVPKNLLDLIPKNILGKSKFITQNIPICKNNEKKDWNQYTVDRLLEYYMNAKMIITSKLHCMCPSIALGIPTIALGNNFSYRYSFCDAFLKVYDETSIDTVDWFSYDTFENIDYIKDLLLKVAHSLIAMELDMSAVKKLDDFYTSRKRWDYCHLMKQKVRYIFSKKKDFKYIIWGASAAGNTVYSCINELYPQSQLVEVIDSFAEGIWEGKQIRKPEEVLNKYPGLTILISTLSGKEYVEEYLNKLGKRCNIDYFVIHENIQ